MCCASEKENNLVFRTCEYFTPALLPQNHDVMNAKTIVDSQHQKLHKSRRYTDDPPPPTIFANLNVAMNDRDSFFQVFLFLFVRILLSDILNIQLVSRKANSWVEN